jgi:hypothetical protein
MAREWLRVGANRVVLCPSSKMASGAGQRPRKRRAREEGEEQDEAGAATARAQTVAVQLPGLVANPADGEGALSSQAHSFKSAAFLARRAGEALSAKPAAQRSLKRIVAAEHFDLLPQAVATCKRALECSARRLSNRRAADPSIAAPRSLLPPKTYCDLCGLAARYRDPRTRLRFAAGVQQRFLSSLSTDVVKQLLASHGTRATDAPANTNAHPQLL